MKNILKPTLGAGAMTQLGKSKLRVWEALSSCPSTPGPILQRHTLGVARIVGLKIQFFSFLLLFCFCSDLGHTHWCSRSAPGGALETPCDARNQTLVICMQGETFPPPPYYLSNLHIQIIQIPFLSFFCCCYSNDHEFCTQLVAVLTRAYTYFFLVIDIYLSCISGHSCLHMLVVGLAVVDQARNTNISPPRAPSAGVRNSMITECG